MAKYNVPAEVRSAYRKLQDQVKTLSERCADLEAENRILRETVLSQQSQLDRPVQIIDASGGPPHVQTIEKTGKCWKALYLVATVSVLAGVFLFVLAIRTDHVVAGLSGMLLLVVGMLGYIVARFGAWWFHG